MKHSNAGTPWTELERTNLRELFLTGASLEQLVKAHGRSPNALVSELHNQRLLTQGTKAYYRVDPVPFITFAAIREMS